MASKLPPGLALCREYLADLENRLKGHLGQSVAASYGSGSGLVGNLGKWLDKGINKIIGIDAPVPAAGNSAAVSPAGSAANLSTWANQSAGTPTSLVSLSSGRADVSSSRAGPC